MARMARAVWAAAGGDVRRALGARPGAELVITGLHNSGAAREISGNLGAARELSGKSRELSGDLEAKSE